MLGDQGNEGVERGEVLGIEQLAIRRGSADLHAATGLLYPLQLRQLADVDERIRLGEPEPEQWKQTVPAGDHLGVLAERLERVVQILGAHVLEGGRDHGLPPPPFACWMAAQTRAKNLNDALKALGKN